MGVAAQALPPRHFETGLARALIAGQVTEDSTVTFKVKGDELVLG